MKNIKCRKGIYLPKAETCTPCEFYDNCKLELIKKSASKIDDIKLENTNSILDKYDRFDQKGEENFGVFYVILRILVFSAIFAAICGLIGLIIH